MYDDADLAVLHNGKISTPFQTNTGVKQGCPLSPQGSITISSKTVDFVDHFTYLGTIISSSGGVEKDVESRLCKARSAFGRLHRIWRNQQISRRTKLRIFNACVKSILLYGAETWLTFQRMMTKLQSFINKCLRIICGIFWPKRLSNSDLWRNTGEAPIHHQIKKKKWKWIGHALRKKTDSIVRKALDWNPQGSRRVGRPKLTWRRTIIQELSRSNITWDYAKQTAPNRVRFKVLVNALSSQAE
ncbi:uncharacterized protein LOC123257659 [Drosophila ananassae]|uniref:uncharacterized protein LOC123257659 n=1 Tax=Drosophila ananassae TaxID=7217 RepID=UPI001CFFA231|nr:uncharacterized protein LOC123257659 [Drosophila ananassae]